MTPLAGKPGKPAWCRPGSRRRTLPFEGGSEEHAALLFERRPAARGNAYRYRPGDGGPEDPAKAAALINYVWWAETAGQAKAAALGYAPLPAALRPWIADRLASITAGGRKVWTASAAR